MTSGVGQAIPVPSTKQKAAAQHGAPKGSALAFGKALRDDLGEAGRQDKIEGRVAEPPRWAKVAESLSARLDANGTATPAGEDIPLSVGQVSAAPDTSQRIAPEPPLPPTEMAADALLLEDGASLTPRPVGSLLEAKERAPAASPPQVSDEPIDVDPLVELRRALAPDASDRPDQTATSEPDIEGPSDTPDEPDDRVPPVEAPRTRIPEPLIYLAGVTTPPRQVDAGSQEPEPEHLGKRAEPLLPTAAEGDASERSMTTATQAAPLIALAAAGQPIVAPGLGTARRTMVAGNVTPTPASASAPTASQDNGVSGDDAKSLTPEPRPTDARKAAAPPAANAMPAPAAPAPDRIATEQDGTTGKAADGSPVAEDEAGRAPSPTANDPRRSEQPVVAPRVSVAAEQAFAAPAQPMANPTVAGLTDAIATSQPVTRPVAASVPVAKPDAGGTSTLQIQLNPAELGMVTAHLKVTGGQLSVELQVESSEAYHRLTRDGDAIVASLRKHGYDIDTVTVLQPQAAVVQQGRVDSPATASGSTARDGSQMPSGDTGSGGQGSSSQSSGRQGTGNFDGRENHAQTAPGRSGGGIFI